MTVRHGGRRLTGCLRMACARLAGVPSRAWAAIRWLACWLLAAMGRGVRPRLDTGIDGEVSLDVHIRLKQ